MSVTGCIPEKTRYGIDIMISNRRRPESMACFEYGDEALAHLSKRDRNSRR